MGICGVWAAIQVQTEFLSAYDVPTAGSREHRECWIPADSLRELNTNIVGEIEVVSEFHGAVRQSQNPHPNLAQARR